MGWGHNALKSGKKYNFWGDLKRLQFQQKVSKTVDF